MNANPLEGDPTHEHQAHAIEIVPQLSCVVLRGARAIVDLRNSLVHPQSESTASDGAYDEAAQLALRYVELLLLRHIGYEGEYIDRIAAHFEGHGRPESVPWQAFDSQCDDNRVTDQA